MTLSDKEILAFLQLRVLLKSSHPEVPEFLAWIYTRLCIKHGEDKNIDYMLKLKDIAIALHAIRNVAFLEHRKELDFGD